MRDRIVGVTQLKRRLGWVPVLVLIVGLAACERTDGTDSVPADTARDASLDARPADDVAQHVEARVREVDQLRISNAATLEPGQEVTQETFGEVCRPVGVRVQAIAAEEGWVFRQLATRNRNPANYPDPEAERLIARFESEQDLMDLWVRTNIDGEDGYRYMRRIETQGTCLACHGARDERPAFVVENYPEDRGYGFVAGELRGVYSVFVHDSIAAPARLPAR